MTQFENLWRLRRNSRVGDICRRGRFLPVLHRMVRGGWLRKYGRDLFRAGISGVVKCYIQLLIVNSYLLSLYTKNRQVLVPAGAYFRYGFWYLFMSSLGPAGPSDAWVLPSLFQKGNSRKSDCCKRYEHKYVFKSGFR